MDLKKNNLVATATYYFLQKMTVTFASAGYATSVHESMPHHDMATHLARPV